MGERHVLLQDFMSLSSEELVQADFRLVDRDGSGTISRDELFMVMHVLDAGYWNREKVDALLAEMDTNRNDEVDYNEFVDFVFRKRGKGDDTLGLFNPADREKLRQSMLTPGLERISVPFARALLGSPSLLEAVANRVDTLAVAILEDNDRGSTTKGAAAIIYKQLGLEPPAEAATGPPNEILRTALEEYLDRHDSKITDGGTSVLACRFLSTEVVRVAYHLGMRVADVQAVLSYTRGLPACLFQLLTADFVPVGADRMVAESFPDLAAVVIVLSADLVVGDAIRAMWSRCKLESDAGSVDEWYGGNITDVQHLANQVRYGIRWQDGSTSRGVHCQGAVWRTAFGGVIYAIEKA